MKIGLATHVTYTLILRSTEMYKFKEQLWPNKKSRETEQHLQ
jgi:hypothetical protein